jgi:hypothetical protein
MTDPLTALSASAIASLAFQEFIKSGAGELAKQFAPGAIDKMGQLRKLVWNRVTGKHPTAATALEQAKAGDPESIDTVATLLSVEMLDREFAEQVREIAHEITLLQIEDNSSMKQTNYGGTNYQTKTGANNTNFFGGDHQHGQQ